MVHLFFQPLVWKEMLLAAIGEHLSDYMIPGNVFLHGTSKSKEHSGSVVEFLTQDRGAAGLSLTGVTTLCP